MQRHTSVVVAYALMGDYERAIVIYTAEINPEYAEAYYNRGLAYALMGDKERAICAIIIVQ